MNVKVSIIVPVFKAEAYLHKCIESILRQTYIHIELILVNDGSPDRSGEICEEYAKLDNRIKVIHKHNGGIGSAYNEAFKILTGNYVCFVDSDDYIAQDFIKKMIEVLVSRKADIVHAGIYYVDDEGTITGTTTDEEIEIHNGDEILYNYFKNNLHPGLGSTIFKRVLFNNFTFLEQNLGIDELTTPQILHKCKKIVYVKEKYYFCYQSRDSVSRERITVNNFMQRLKMFDELNSFVVHNGKDLAPYVSKKFIIYLVTCNFANMECLTEEKGRCEILQKQRFKEHYRIYKQNKNKLKFTKNTKIIVTLFNIYPPMSEKYLNTIHLIKKFKTKYYKGDENYVQK